jgi:hypothetical protein
VQDFNRITKSGAKHACQDVVFCQTFSFRDKRTHEKTKSQQHTSFTVMCGSSQIRQVFKCLFVVYEGAGADARASKAINTRTAISAHGS